MKRVIGGLIGLVLAMVGLGGPARAATLPAVAPVMACAALRMQAPEIPGYPAQITDAREDAGMCRVQGYVSPQIRFEVRLPLTGWTQRYLQTGCGGLCGNLRIQAPQRPCPALARGEFATASTDMGHAGQGGVWGASDQQLRVDFGYRGVHATALVAKALIARFYGRGPRWSYFSGCSDGGREALMEAQRYPEDFDGIAAGAPAMNFLVQNSLHHGWMARQSVPDGRNAVLSAADMAPIHAAALAACDAADGLKDGLVSEPLACRFDPRTIACTGGPADGCVAPAAAAAAAALYAGAHDAEGRRLVVGGLMPGSELAWPGVGVPRAPGQAAGSAMFASDMVPWLAYPKPLTGWRLADLRFDVATLRSLTAMHGIYDATDPDLRRFAAHGGRLLMWHGWSDQHISPANTVAYAQAVAEQMGQAAAGAVLRTFLVPGMYHCDSGDGLTSIDVLSPLMAWVEDGTAPDRIIASRDDAAAAAGKGRPVFAWPTVSRLATGGDPDDPAAWSAAPPARPTPRLHAEWEGAAFYRTGYRRDCGFEGERWVCRPAR